MAKIDKKHQKVFGQDAPPDQFGKIGSRAEGTPTATKDIDEMQSSPNFPLGYFKVAETRSGGTRLPATEELNSLLYLMTYQEAYNQQAGIPEWDEKTEYYANASYVQYQGNLYLAIKGRGNDLNVNKKPTDRSYWSEPFNPEDVLQELTHIWESGVFQWDATRNYTLNDIVKYNGIVYRSATAQENIGNIPSETSGGFWVDIVDRSEVERAVATIQQKGAVPIGYAYIRFPGTPVPDDLFGGTWVDESHTLRGGFIRFESNNVSAPFGAFQAARAGPHLEQIKSRGLGTYTGDSSSSIYLTTGRESSTLGPFPYRGAGERGWGMDFILSSEEGHPRNYTVQLWKRTA